MVARSRRLVGAAAAALLAAPAVALAANAAGGSAPKVVTVTVTPSAVVKAASSKGTATFAIAAQVTDPDGVDTVFAGLFDRENAVPDGRAVALARTSGTAKSGTWTGKVTTNKADPVGTWDVRLFASDKDGMSDPDAVHATFALQDPVRISSFDMSPEPPVDKVLGMSGKLQRYSSGTWVAYSGKYVTLEFRGLGTDAWVAAGRWKSGSQGTFGAKNAVPSAATGSWRVSYAGNDHRSAAVSREDSVTIP